jgi:thiamine pyrophosphate-dependent acetolactate synthase large subunit-like protein
VLVAEAIGRALAAHGVDTVFGLLGSGNLTVTNALRDAGARFVAARHECGAICMADGYARVSGKLPACSVHQGPGLTNTITGLTEAAKSRTPLVLLAADTPAAALRSNFRIDQAGLVEAVGAVAERVHSAETAMADVARAVRRARVERRAVVLMLPLDVQAGEAEFAPPPPAPDLRPTRPSSAAIEDAAQLLRAAERPAVIAGRGAVLAGAGPALRRLGEVTGAVLATSAVANGLFAGDPFSVGIAGGFSSPTAARLLCESDVVIAFGAALNQWTTRHGTLITGTVIQVDRDEEAIAAHRPADLGIVGDALATAEALLDALGAGPAASPRALGAGPAASPGAPVAGPAASPGAPVAGPTASRRTAALAAEIAAGAWRHVPYDESTTHVDPRTLSIALDNMLPAERTVVVDSGHFMGWPSMYLGVPDAAGFVFPQAFQCVGLALGNAIGAAIARPDRLTVAALGDGGALLALPELETLGRLRLPILVVIYDDAAYGAEVHHFRPMGQAVDLAQFPATDFVGLAQAAGCWATDNVDDLRGWLANPDGPMVLDAKIDPDIVAEWLEEAFR